MESWQLAAREAPSPLGEMGLKKVKQFPNAGLTNQHKMLSLTTERIITAVALGTL